MSITYEDAGVNISEGNRVVELISEAARSTFSPAVLTGLGSFGSFFDLTGVMEDYRSPVMVQSIDGTGTKSVLARQAGNFSNLGRDLVSACCNDIAVHGAKPLTLLDYIAQDTLNAEEAAVIIRGIAEGCREIGVSLVGGETAEMPGTYLPGAYDLVGVVTGVAERDQIINGSGICEGDVLIGVPSSGLHTNGYSLARAVIGSINADLHEVPVLPDGESGSEPLADLLLKAHLSYTPGIMNLLNKGISVKGMAHITGGGLIENIPRILPEAYDAVIDVSSWETPFIFRYLQHHGDISVGELYRTFNMGIGLVIILSESAFHDAGLSTFDGCFSLPCRQIGSVVSGFRRTVLQRQGEVLL